MLKLITDITDDWTSGLGGLKVGKYIEETFSQNYQTPVELSFYGIDMITPSFVNGAFLYVMDLYDAAFFYKNIKISQIKRPIAELIRSSVKGYQEHNNKFIQQLKTNHIYCAIDGSEDSINFRYKLFKATENQGFKFSFNPDDSVFSEKTWEKIRQSDVCVGIIEEYSIIDNITKQINYALEQSKPCIVLCNKKIQLKVPHRDKIKVFYYDENNYYKTVKEINQLLIENKVAVQNSSIQKDIDKELIAAFALGAIGGAAIGVIFSALFDDD